MMNASEKIAALRSAMASKGVAGYLIPSADPHMSEYLPPVSYTHLTLPTILRV